MIKCKSCNQLYDYNGILCPYCKNKNIPTADEISAAREELNLALTMKNYSRALSARLLLADSGDTEAQREYAKAIESQYSDMNSLDKAMEYYKRAALANDAYSAYRYSRLADRTSAEAGKFWLEYSAILGAKSALCDAAELLSEEGNESLATYYYYLSAEEGNTDAIVTMARRYYEGVGTEQNEAYAKFYIDMLSYTPINVIKMAYKLRATKAEEPKALTFPDKENYLVSLSERAKASGIHTAYFKIVSILADEGSIAHQTTLGILLAEGVGCEKNPSRALGALMNGVAHGDAKAAFYLAKAYLTGSFVEKDAKTAYSYFKTAAKLGEVRAYESIGDIYYKGELGNPNPEEALAYYERGAEAGLAGAREKAKSIKARRAHHYNKAISIMTRAASATKEEAEDAFRSLAIATAMGHVNAPLALGECYSVGFGCQKSRSSAFLWYEKAAAKGDADALLPLGLCYSRGEGVARSYRSAIHLLTEAYRITQDSEAYEEIKLLRTRRTRKLIRSAYSACMGLLYQKKTEEAYEALVAIEELGYPKALYTLGALYEFGIGVKKNNYLCSVYYKKAADGNSAYDGFCDKDSSYKLRILKLIR